MGKFLYVFQKNKNSWVDTEKICDKVLLLTDDQPYTNSSENQFLWINNSNGIKVEEFSLLTGAFTNENKLEHAENFTFKLISKGNFVTIVSDLTASRTVWYCVTKNRIIISSSQRVIISLLGDFQVNKQAISWMLTNGCLGPGHSWDKRINHLGPSKEISFNTNSFESSTLNYVSNNENIDSLHEVFDKVFSEFNTQKEWGITLSGGYDSRACCYYMQKNGVSQEAYTWGVPGSIDVDYSDANIARKVSQELEVPFHMMNLDYRTLSSKIILKNFLQHGEGRIDHINAFIDGLKMWETLGKENKHAIVRSDEAFGWVKVGSERDTRISLEIANPSDFSNLNELFFSGSWQEPDWPKEYAKQPDESIAKWRDRLYQQYRLPYILAALHDLMLPFVEIVNPLLDSRFINWANAQTDFDRSDKAKYKKFVECFLSSIPVAKVPSIPEPEKILRDDSFQEEIYLTLNNQLAKDLLGDKLVTYVLDRFRNQDIKPQIESVAKRRLKNLFPFWLKKLLRRTVLPYQLDHNRLVIRCYIIVSMHKMLNEDIDYVKCIKKA